MGEKPVPEFTPLSDLPAPSMPAIPERVLEPFEAKHPGGRPTKYRPEFCDAVIEDGKLGYSLTAFAATISVDRDTLKEWANVHPEFSAAVKEHKAHRARRWEGRLDTIGEKGGGQGSAVATIFALKNIAPDEWRDRVEHTGADGGPLEISWMAPTSAPAGSPVIEGDAARDITPREPARVQEASLPDGEAIAVGWADAAPANEPAAVTPPRSPKRGDRP